MSDPLSILAAVTGIAGLALHSARRLKEFVDGIQGAPHAVSALSRDLNALYNVLGTLTALLDDVNLNPNPAQATFVPLLQAPLDNCVAALQDITLVIRRFTKPSGTAKITKWRGFAWNFREREVTALQTILMSYKSSLDIAIAVANLSSSTTNFCDIKNQIHGLQRRLDADCDSVADSSFSDSCAIGSDYGFALRRFLLETESIIRPSATSSPPTPMFEPIEPIEPIESTEPSAIPLHADANQNKAPDKGEMKILKTPTVVALETETQRSPQLPVRTYREIEGRERVQPLTEEEKSKLMKREVANVEAHDAYVTLVQKHVTSIHTATNELLETLIKWSKNQAQTEEISDIYVRVGYEINIVCRAYNARGIDTQDLGPVPDLLKSILEQSLSEPTSIQSLDNFLSRIRDIINLNGLKQKQAELANQIPTQSDRPYPVDPFLLQLARFQHGDRTQNSPKRGDILIALHDFQARSLDELTFYKGDRIQVLDLDAPFDDGWYMGQLVGQERTVGLFPGVFTNRMPSGFAEWFMSWFI